MLCRIGPSFSCSRVAEATLNHPLLFVFVALEENSKEERQKKGVK